MTRLCRTCLRVIKGSTYLTENDATFASSPLIREQLKVCMPDLDLDVIVNSIVCGACTIVLDFAYKFHLACARSEQKIREHIQIHHVMPGVDWCELGAMIAEGSSNQLSSAHVDNRVLQTAVSGVKQDFSIHEFHERGASLRTDEEISSEMGTKEEQDPKIFQSFVKLSHTSSSIDPIEITIETPEVPEDLNHTKLNTTKRYNCSICGHDFPTLNQYRCHMNVHSDQKPFKCKICNINLAHFTSLKRHMITHTGLKAFKCSFCGNRFTTKDSLDFHTKSHTGERPFKCFDCSAMFKSKTCLKLHHLRRHARAKNQSDDDDKPFKCSVCSLGLKRADYLKRHMKTHSREKAFRCVICNNSYTAKSSLDYHMKSHTGEKPFKCSECGVGFKRRDHLRKHMQRHSHFSHKDLPGAEDAEFLNGTEVAKRDSRCIMEVNIKQERNFGDESETVEFSCDTGNSNKLNPSIDGEIKLFEPMGNSERHTQLQLGPYTCSICGLNFTELTAQNEHMKCHSEDKMFNCDICDKSFRQVNNLKRHMRIHTGEKPFGCHMCSNRYTTKDSLDYHIKSHTGEKPFQCLKCNAAFKQKKKLTLHLRSRHPIMESDLAHSDNAISSKEMQNRPIESREIKCEEFVKLEPRWSCE